MQKLACQYVGCACANSTSKAPDISLLWRPLPLVAPVLVCSDSPRMEAGRADSIKESQLENKPDLPPPSHCLLDEDVVEDLYEQDLPKGHSFTLRTRPHQGTQLFPPHAPGPSLTTHGIRLEGWPNFWGDAMAMVFFNNIFFFANFLFGFHGFPKHFMVFIFFWLVSRNLNLFAQN